METVLMQLVAERYPVTTEIVGYIVIVGIALYGSRNVVRWIRIITLPTISTRTGEQSVIKQ